MRLKTAYLILCPLYRYLLTLVRERHLAEEALQETFVRVYRKLKWLREPELFRPWAYRVATREAFRQLKRAWTPSAARRSRASSAGSATSSSHSSAGSPSRRSSSSSCCSRPT